MSSLRHTEQATPAVRSAEDRYLDAARELILAVGWSRSTLTDIARRAGVSRMTLYRRWPDMSSLLGDLMTREWREVITAAGAVYDDVADPRDRLVQSIVGIVQQLRADPLLRRILELDPDILLPYLLERRGRSQDLLSQLLADQVREGQRRGVVRAGDPSVLARSLLLAAHGFTLSAHTMLDSAGEDVRKEPLEQPDLSAYDEQLGELVDRFLRPDPRP